MAREVNSQKSYTFTLADIAKEAELSAIQCYGVVDLYKNQSGDDLIERLKSNSINGAIARKRRNGYEIDLYIVLGYAVRMTEVVVEIQKKVKYDLEKKFKVHFNAINIYVQGVKSL